MSKLLILLFFYFCISDLNAISYDCYTGRPATQRQIQQFVDKNNTRYCIIDVKPCDKNEWRRVDGSCNNLKYPSRGMVRTPTVRVLTPDFNPNYEPRKTKDGKPLPSARYLRTRLLKSGKASDLSITQLVSYYILFLENDVNTIHDILNYILNTTTCCQPEGKQNYMCTPNKMPLDDPVHRYSGVRCHNLTRPQTFQYFGCVDFGTTQFSRISFATPLFDLSGVYSHEIGAIDKLRTFNKGLLKIEVDNGKIFPPSNPDLNPSDPSKKCILNELPKEKRCHRYQTNGVLGPNLFLIQYYRQHNYLAKKLAEMNPCWDDDRLFYTAKDINIAIHLQIFFYELMPVILGRRNLIRDGVVSCSGGFRDMYDKNIQPQLSDEYVYIKRWFHTIQEADLKLYDKDGCYLRSFPIVNLTSRTGYLALDDNMEQFFQGSFRQPSGGFDLTIDYDMAERILGNQQYASDGAMNDLAKGRFFGFPPYVKYREFCTGRSYKTFDSLEDVMTKERIYQMKQVYNNVEDIELMAGTWVENHIPGGRVPYTVYCLMVDQLRRTLASDRHWYERPNRPHAFTLRQLQAIRQVTVAGVMCTNADGVTKIQPKAFYKISNENPLTSCKSNDIGKINLSPWKDEECLQN